MSMDKHLLNSQYKRPLCHTTWESSDLGGTSDLEVVDIKPRVRAVGSCVFHGIGKAAPPSTEVPWPPLFHPALTVRAVFKSYKGISVKGRFICVGSA